MILYYTTSQIINGGANGAGCSNIYTCIGQMGADGGVGVATSTASGLGSILATQIGLIIVIPLVFSVLYWVYNKINKSFKN